MVVRDDMVVVTRNYGLCGSSGWCGSCSTHGCSLIVKIIVVSIKLVVAMSGCSHYGSGGKKVKDS